MAPGYPYSETALAVSTVLREGVMTPEPGTGSVPLIPLAISKHMRSLAHDLSNSIETIMQASYLLSQAKLDDANKKWVELIDTASRDAARINREIREVLRSQSEEN
jgi:hypothetical protein